MNFGAGCAQLAREYITIVLLLIASPPVLVAILPGFCSGEYLCARVENWLGAIGVPFAGPGGLLILKQPVETPRHLLGLSRRLAHHHLPHELDRLAIRVCGAGLLHPGAILVERRAERRIERGCRAQG